MSNNRAAKLVITGLGTGYLPIAPGTWGSLAVCLLYLAVALGSGAILKARGIPREQVPGMIGVAVSLMMLSLAVLSSIGCVAFGRIAETIFGRKDPRQCTIDEWAGQAVALLLLPIGRVSIWLAVVVAFLAFRAMDIIKPSPARRLEKLPQGWGVLTDDLVAGVYANLIAQVVLRVLLLAMAAPLVTAAAAPIIPAPTRPPVMEQKITAVQAAVLGVVEGLTEYLPVSSTGHLILTGQAMGLTRFGGGSGLFGPKLIKVPAIDAFEIVIQLGAILAVAGLYRKRVAQMAMGLVGRSGDGLRLAGMLLVAFLPSAVVGLLLHKSIKEHLFGPVPVCIALAVGGAAMIAAEYFFWIRNRARPRTASLDAVAFRQALIVGLAQCLSLWPGTSRSMVTIVAALIVGMDMVTAAEFSFLLALPTLGMATLYEGAKSFHALLASAGTGGLIIGLVVSWIVAALAVKGFVRWLTRHGLIPFGVYRLLLAGALYAWFLSVR